MNHPAVAKVFSYLCLDYDVSWSRCFHCSYFWSFFLIFWDLSLWFLVCSYANMKNLGHYFFNFWLHWLISLHFAIKYILEWWPKPTKQWVPISSQCGKEQWIKAELRGGWQNICSKTWYCLGWAWVRQKIGSQRRKQETQSDLILPVGGGEGHQGQKCRGTSMLFSSPTGKLLKRQKKSLNAESFLKQHKPLKIKLWRESRMPPSTTILWSLPPTSHPILSAQSLPMPDSHKSNQREAPCSGTS